MAGSVTPAKAEMQAGGQRLLSLELLVLNQMAATVPVWVKVVASIPVSRKVLPLVATSVMARGRQPAPRQADMTSTSQAAHHGPSGCR